MIDWKEYSIPEIVERWNAYITSRDYKMERDHKDFISMNDREWLISDLLNRFQIYTTRPSPQKSNKNIKKNVMIGFKDAQENK